MNKHFMTAITVKFDRKAMSQAIKDIKKDSKKIIKEVQVLLPIEEDMEVVYENV